MTKLPSTIVLTGASRGIGFEAAKLLLPKGVQILGIARNPESIVKARSILNSLGEIHFIQGDVSHKDTAQKTFHWVESKWGQLECLINNAGIQDYHRNFLEEEISTLERTFQVNVFGPHYFIHTLLPLLKKAPSPRIINVSSGAGTIDAVYSSIDMPAYRLSKFTLNGLTALYSTALKGEVAVNSFDPGWLKTDMGGPQAPGEPIDGARRMIALLQKPFKETGKFWHGNENIKF